MLNRVEHEKCFITPGPEVTLHLPRSVDTYTAHLCKLNLDASGL